MGDTGKVKSLTTNSIYYLVYNVLNVLFPFITGIYVARVIPEDLVGRVSYAQNIVQYFAVLSFLGIPTYGLREISKKQNSPEEKNKVYSELLIINAISTTVFSVLYFSVVLIYFRTQLLLYTIVGFSVVINYLNISWLYEGLEEYKYISIRNIVFKFVCLLLLFIFVKGPEDYIVYAAITVLGVAGNYIVNIFMAPKFVQFTIKGLNLKRHLKPIMLLVTVNLAIEIYTLVDTTMIGYFCEEKYVAYYSFGSKINKIFIQIMHTFTMVIVPRITFYYNEGNKIEFDRILSLTFKLICLLSVPLIIGIFFCSDYAVTLLYGEAYIRSAKVLKILSLTILVSPVGYLLGSRIMLVTNNESKMPFCVGAGAICNVILNRILIPIYFEFGAAIASVISELVVMTVYLLFARKYFSLFDYKETILKLSVASFIMAICLFIFEYIKPQNLLGFIFQIIIGVITYFGVLVVIKEKTLITLLKRRRLFDEY